MFIKLPIEVEIPDSVEVGNLTLTPYGQMGFEQYIHYDVHRDGTLSTLAIPVIFIDLFEHIVEGDMEGDYEGEDITFTEEYSADGDHLYEAILDVADMLDEEYNRIMQTQGLEKSASKSRTVKVKKTLDWSDRKFNSVEEGDKYVIHRNLNYESFYPATYTDEMIFLNDCLELEDRGWTLDKEEYVDGIVHKWYSKLE